MRVGIKELELFNGKKINFSDSNDFFIITGPNNSGKTKFLSEIEKTLTGSVNTSGSIVRSSQLMKDGNHESLERRLADFGFKSDEGWIFPNVRMGYRFEAFYRSSGLSGLERVIVSNLNTAYRLQMIIPPNAIDFRSEPKSHPLHFLHRDKNKRDQLSRWFKRAFGTEIAMDMLGSKVIPLHVGEGAEPKPNENFINDAYLGRLRSLPRLDEQGDGMKSFTGVILNILYGRFDIVFLDEPEAFLHPPQARLLGNILGRERPDNVQLFVATHSADFIRGAMESSDKNLRIARISRDGDDAQIYELATEEIERSWSDPVLRFSNVIDGLFHERVVVCEADGDCRFYSAIAEALRKPADHPFVRDVMFIQAGGKGGISKLVLALRALKVPVAAVADFDIFRQSGQLDSIISALGGKPTDFADDIRAIRADIMKVGARPNAREIKRNINEILDLLDDNAEEIASHLEKKLKDAVKSPPGWARAKTTGLGYLDRSVQSVGQRLLDSLSGIGLHIVPVGEIESFETKQTASKNQWVEACLSDHKDDIGTTQDLVDARAFVTKLISR